MMMSVKPRYLLIAGAAAVGLYFAGVSPGVLLLLLWGAYMLSMHLGGGHGGGHGHGGGTATPAEPAQAGEQDPATGHAHRGC